MGLIVTNRRLRYLSGTAAMVLVLSGCTAIPTSGPVITTKATPVAARQNQLDHIVVDVTPDIARRLSKSIGGGESLGSFRAKGGAATIRLGVGDTVGVTIFEAAAGGLFIPNDAGSRNGNFVTLPDQAVDRTGTISVPYAGQISVVGRTVPAVQAEVEERLRNRAIEPQVIISVKTQTAAQVSVLGEVNLPSRFAVNPAGERVLDVIARAGGPKGLGYESFITLQRGKMKRTIYFNKLVNDPSNNIFVQPGDTVYVYTQNRSFVVVGATGLNGKFNFDSEQTTASEAMGRAGGLLDSQANPAAVYIYRQIPRSTLMNLGADVSKWPQDSLVPVILRFNLRKEDGFFTLRQFQIEDKDVLYVENASSVDFVKAVNVMRTTVAVVDETNIARNNLRNLN